MPGISTVLRWKANYIAAGKDIVALVESCSSRGNRKPRHLPAVLDIVDKAIEAKYLTRHRKTVQDTVDYAQLLVSRENDLRPEVDQLPLPSRRLVQRVIDAIPKYDKHVARYGKDAANKMFRSVLRHRVTSAPLERAEIDHTRMDVFVVDDRTGAPRGRPWLTVCIDDYSRCVLGYHIGWDSPSYLTVARCLKHAFLPKTTLKQDFPEIKNQWNAHGVMRELVVDNGVEFHSRSLEKVCYSVGTEIHYMPRKHAWSKGKIERFQGTLNRETAHGVPGTTFSNIFEKDDYDPVKHAVITESTLRKIVPLWIVDVYHQRVHRALDTHPDRQWDVSIDPEDILVPDDPAQLDAILGRRDERSLTHKGIELDGLLYNSPELTEMRYRLGDKLEVEVSIDDEDLGSIVVFSPDMTRMLKVPALASEYASGLSRWQHGVCKRYAKNQAMGTGSRAWLEAKEAISELIANDVLKKRRKAPAKAARFTDKPTKKSKSATPAQEALPASPNTPAQPPAATAPSTPSPAPATAKASVPKPHFSPVITNRSPEAPQ